MTTAVVQAIPAATLRAVAAALRSGLEALAAVAPQRFADWAQEHFLLSGDASHSTGRWELWPFQVGLLDWMGDDGIEELDVRKSKRVGYTKALSAFIGYNAAHRHRKQALWQPTDDDRDSFVATEVDPVLDGVRAVRAARRATKGIKDRVGFKRFRSSVAHFLGGKASRAYRRITVAVVMLDELDGFDQEIEKAGDPVTLAQGRLEGAPFPKTVCGSTPRIKGLSHIAHRESLADVAMRFNITCQHCSVEHPLMWGGKKSAYGFQWDPGDPDSACHVCPHCRTPIRQADYLANWHGSWVCERTGKRFGQDRIWRDANGQEIDPPRHVSAHVWAAYSPQRSWSSIARENEAAERKKAADDSGPMKVFVNETRGEVWAEEVEKTEKAALIARAEDYPLRLVPRRGLILFAGVDVQDDRLVCVVAAFGRASEVWVIDDRVIWGDPGQWSTWAALDVYLSTRFPHEGGQTCAIDGVAIDTGGHFTHIVYRYTMLREGRRVYATKGHSIDGKPIIAGPPSKVDVNADGQIIKDGAKLWFIGTGTAKDNLHHRLNLPAPIGAGPAPGYIHLSKELPEAFFDELTAEQRTLMRSSKGTVYRWVKPTSGRRNERLDCMVGILFCAALQKVEQAVDAEWRRLEQVLCPPTADLFAPPRVEPLPPPEQVAPRVSSIAQRSDEAADDDESDVQAEVVAVAAPAELVAAAPVWITPRGRRVRGVSA